MTEQQRSRGAWRPKSCRRCQRHEEQAGRISKQGNCSECAARLVLAQMMEVRIRSGPQYDAWLAGMERARAAGKHMGRPRSVKGGSG